ncbi:BnaA03g12620D [Brassica napus]|uniref:BnaA03g12620D protein n=1 Tax=Brassica napus TaxID=3708 RepID=A0A078HLZ1_BRANA|nr:BnaA03g12620D [Brassica napus]
MKRGSMEWLSSKNGKYVDSFLKGIISSIISHKIFDFLEAHFQDHNELFIQLGMKQTAIPSRYQQQRHL